MFIDRGYRPSSALQAVFSVYHTSPLSNPWWMRAWRCVTFQTNDGSVLKWIVTFVRPTPKHPSARKRKTSLRSCQHQTWIGSTRIIYWNKILGINKLKMLPSAYKLPDLYIPWTKARVETSNSEPSLRGRPHSKGKAWREFELETVRPSHFSRSKVPFRFFFERRPRRLNSAG